MKKHFLQSQIWADIRAKQGHLPVLLQNNNLLLIKSAFKGIIKVGNISQVDLDTLDFDQLLQLAKEQGLTYIHIDPVNLAGKTDLKSLTQKYPLIPTEPWMLRDTVIVDLKQSEEELLNNIEKNTRYNIKYAAKKGITCTISDADQDFEIFLDIFFQTPSQKYFFSRGREYYRTIWHVCKQNNAARIAIAYFEGQPQVARFLFVYKKTIYTPYTGYITQHLNLKPTYRVLWEIMLWGKANGYENINLWGIKPELGPEDQEFGYTKFKMNFSLGNTTKYEKSYDLVINRFAYQAIKMLNQVRWIGLKILKLIKRLMKFGK